MGSWLLLVATPWLLVKHALVLKHDAGLLHGIRQLHWPAAPQMQSYSQRDICLHCFLLQIVTTRSGFVNSDVGTKTQARAAHLAGYSLLNPDRPLQDHATRIYCIAPEVPPHALDEVSGSSCCNQICSWRQVPVFEGDAL